MPIIGCYRVGAGFSWRVGYRVRSSSIVTLGRECANRVEWMPLGDGLGELFLGRVLPHPAARCGRALGPGRIVCAAGVRGDATYGHKPADRAGPSRTDGLPNGMPYVRRVDAPRRHVSLSDSPRWPVIGA